MNKWTVGAIVAVAVVAAFFRLYKFPAVPPSLNWDEVSFGYNAYSILRTGKDEFGKSMPVYFRSLDDYKLPVYMYLTVGSIKLFGYNDWAVRFPSAFFGVATVIMLWFLAWELWHDQKAAFLSALFLAILPWHVQFSRMAAEANVGLFFLTAGATLFLYGLKRHLWLFGSLLAFELAAYSYLSFRLIAVLLGLGLIGLYYRRIAALNKRWLLILGLGAVMAGGLLIQDTLVNRIHIRLSGTIVWNTSGANDAFKENEAEMFYDAKLKINLIRRFFHDNTFFTGARIVIQGYLSHFSPGFLFFDYNERHHQTPFVGLLYLWMLPFIPIGGYAMWRHKNRSSATLVLLWLLLSPIPAAITWDIPHAIRVLGMVIPLMMLTAWGVVGVGQNIKSVKTRWTGGLILGLIIGISSLYFLHQYIIHLPQERSDQWVYGRQELSAYLEAQKQNYRKIVVSSKLEWPYAFLLYYSKYDPQSYLDQGGTKSGGWGEEGNKYDTYEFHQFHAEDFAAWDNLLVGIPDEFNNRFKPIKVIDYLDGKPAIMIVNPASPYARNL